MANFMTDGAEARCTLSSYICQRILVAYAAGTGKSEVHTLCCVAHEVAGRGGRDSIGSSSMTKLATEATSGRIASKEGDVQNTPSMSLYCCSTPPAA